MIRRVLLGAALAATPMCAQLQLFVPQGEIERPVATQFDFGPVPNGDTLDVRFRIRNTGSYAASLTTLSVSGAGFSLTGAPPLPYPLVSGAAVDFTVRFLPPDTGQYSAVLRVNSLSPIIRGSGLPTVAVLFNSTALTPGAAIDLGTVERGATLARNFALANQTRQPLTVQSLLIAGPGFRFGSVFSLPLKLDPGQTAPFDVVYEPKSTGAVDGAMAVDQRRFTFMGTVVEPPLPQPKLSVEPSALTSAIQGKLTVRFSEPSRTAGAGKVTLDFQPSASGFPTDPAILFPAANGRTATFNVVEGQSSAQLEFQSGTTAGTLTFTAELGANTDQIALTIPPAPMGVDTIRGTRTSTGVEVFLAGWDNTGSASAIAFTFYDIAGAMIGSAIRADLSADFRKYFHSSDIGGVFGLRAVFPVQGDATRIAGVEAEVVNSVGTTRTRRASF